MNPGAEAEVERVKDLKQYLVTTHGVGTDLTPQSILWRRGSILGSLLFPLDREAMYRALSIALAFTHVDRVTFFIEGYAQRQPDPESYTYGEGVKRFAAGDPTVDEVIMVALGTPVGCDIITVPYRYAGRTIEWGEPDEPDAIGGVMVDAIAEGFATRSRETLTLAEVGALLGIPVIHPVRP